MNIPARIPSPLDAIVHEAGRKLQTLHMTRIAGEADEHDARSLQDDLTVIWEIIDPVIKKIGEYAAENFHGIDQSHFDSPIERELSGNATYTLEEAAQDLIESRADTRAEIKSTFERA